MLALVSSMTTTVIGCTSLTKTCISCGLSLSKISKSVFVRSGTRRFCASMTVAKTDTRRVPDRKTPCCAKREIPARMTNALERTFTRNFMTLISLHHAIAPGFEIRLDWSELH